MLESEEAAEAAKEAKEAKPSGEEGDRWVRCLHIFVRVFYRARLSTK